MPRFGSSSFGSSGFGSSNAAVEFGGSGFGSSQPQQQQVMFGQSGFGSKPVSSIAGPTSQNGARGSNGGVAFGQSGFGAFATGASPFATASSQPQQQQQSGSFGNAATGAQPSPFGLFANNGPGGDSSLPAFSQVNINGSDNNDKSTSQSPFGKFAAQGVVTPEAPSAFGKAASNENNAGNGTVASKPSPFSTFSSQGFQQQHKSIFGQSQQPNSNSGSAFGEKTGTVSLSAVNNGFGELTTATAGNQKNDRVVYDDDDVEDSLSFGGISISNKEAKPVAPTPTPAPAKKEQVIAVVRPDENRFPLPTDDPSSSRPNPVFADMNFRPLTLTERMHEFFKLSGRPTFDRTMKNRNGVSVIFTGNEFLPNVGDLTLQERHAFESAEFEIGMVPEIPPPLSFL
ncbi:hypothetical protein V1514DRAFT_368573 [Lipomyces japonicus]|uniref:uncharacterized protein n=1 Tax=Lipomyces japonicus TaxID=56871 RepID=UPI0034CE8516